MKEKYDFYENFSLREKIFFIFGIILFLLLLLCCITQMIVTIKTYKVINEMSISNDLKSENTNNDDGIVWANSNKNTIENSENKIDSSINSSEVSDSSIMTSSQGSTTLTNNSNTTSQGSKLSNNTTSIASTTNQNTPVYGKTDYVLNKDSKKIHSPTCSSALRMKEENKQYVSLTDSELESYFNQGYTVCGICKAGN